MANFNLYNSPFDNFTQRTYVPQTPQNRLQVAYQQAMAKRTPEWARTISDMMPSIAEMVAYGTTKGAFNQGRIADSLEREKQRRIAYNQMMRENEDKQVNDYVQLAKEQLGIDMAEDDKEYGRNLDQIKREEELEKQKRAYQQYEEQQRIAEEQRKFDNDIKEREMALKEALAKQQQENANKEQTKQQQEIEANIEQSFSDINNLEQAKSLNSEAPKGSIMTAFKAGLNPLAKIPNENRLSPIYQAFTKETDPKKLDVEVMKLGFDKDMSPKDFDKNANRLIREKKQYIIQQYAKLGYKILQDDKTGRIRVVDTKGNTVKEF